MTDGVAIESFSVGDLVIIPGPVPPKVTKNPRLRNPDFLRIDELGEQRAVKVAHWALRHQLGGQYRGISSKLDQFLKITLFKKPKPCKNKGERNTINALAVLLSKHKDFDFCACLMTRKNGVTSINKGSKANQRNALANTFGTHDKLTGAARYEVGVGVDLQGNTIKNFMDHHHDRDKSKMPIDQYAVDMPMYMRKVSGSIDSCRTFSGVADTVLRTLAALSIEKGIPVLTMAEDLGGCLQKAYTEWCRDVQSAAKSSTSVPVVFDFDHNELPNNLNAGWFGKYFGDRSIGGFRDKWRTYFKNYIESNIQHVCLDIFKNKGKVQYCGYGETKEERMSTYELNCELGVVTVIRNQINLAEDTNQVHCTVDNLLVGKNCVIWAEDSDLVLIALNVVTELMLKYPEKELGSYSFK